MIALIKISDLTPANTTGRVLFAETDFDSLYKIEGISKDCDLICSYKVTGLSFPVQRTFAAHRGQNVIIADYSDKEADILAFQLKIAQDRRIKKYLW